MLYEETEKKEIERVYAVFADYIRESPYLEWFWSDKLGYLLLNSPLVPVESTVSILKRQTMMITIMLVFFGFLISFYVANHIATPITRITQSAKRLAHGDYAVKFEGGGYAEVDDLAETLTYAAHELSKTDQMQRDLIANVSHDLRTPLTMMKAYAEMIRDPVSYTHLTLPTT